MVSACSRKDGSDTVNMQEVVNIDDLSPEEKEKLFKTSGLILKENKSLADNLSRIETSRNEQGMKTERYFYKNLPNLKYIEIYTFANGTKQIIIYGENGTVKSLSENSLAWLAKATPEELTGETQAYTEEQKENSSGIKINTLPPIVVQSTPATQDQPTPQAETQPKNEKQNEANVKTDASSEKKDSRMETTSPNKKENQK